MKKYKDASGLNITIENEADEIREWEKIDRLQQATISLLKNENERLTKLLEEQDNDTE